MTLTPRLRQFLLTAHITCSVGWLGAVACFLVLAVAGLAGTDANLARAAYLAMELSAGWVILPLSLAALATGVLQSLGTHWGLFRHYWVVAKLLITVVSTLLLLLHLQPVRHMAGAAAGVAWPGTDLHALQVQLVANAAAAVVALLAATALSVYKPSGLTPYGRQTQQSLPAADSVPHPAPTGVPVGSAPRPSGAARPSATPGWVKAAGFAVVLLVRLVGILHLAGLSPGGHGW
jgi:hypothetical protein